MEIIEAKDDEFNRKILEKGNVNVLVSVEKGRRKDTLKNLDSGLNEILARIAAKKNVLIGINVDEISILSKKGKAERLSRIIRNIRICRKAKANIVGANIKSKEGFSALMTSLGASSQQTYQSVQKTISF